MPRSVKPRRERSHIPHVAQPAAPELTRTRSTSSRDITGYRRFCILAAVIFILLVLRRPDCVTNPQFWAEDGSLFFRWQLLYGFQGSVLSPYNGYLSVLQRTVAAFAAWFPIYYAPLLYAITGSILDALCCAVFALPRFRHVLRSDAMRMTVCILVATVPPANELIGTLVNVPWFVLLAGTLLVFRSNPPPDNQQGPAALRQTLQAAGWGMLGLLFAFTMPVLVLAVPFCVWRIVRDWRPERAYEVCLTLALLVQFWLFLGMKQMPSDVSGIQKIDMLAAALIVGFVYRAVMTLLAGYKLTMMTFEGKSLSLPLLALVATVIWLTVLWLKSGRERRRDLSIALYVAVSSLAITLGGRNAFANFANIGNFRGAQLERYVFLAGCVFIYLLAASIERMISNRPVRYRIAALAALLACGLVYNYSIPAFPDRNWKASAAVIQQQVDRHRVGTERISVPILPDGWDISIP